MKFFFSKIYFLDQIYWQALARPFKWHIGKVCIINRKKVTETWKNVKKGLEFVLFHFFDNENGENIFFGPSQLKVPKRWVLMVLKVFQCLLKQKSYKPNKIFLDLLSTNWAFEPLWGLKRRLPFQKRLVFSHNSDLTTSIVSSLVSLSVCHQNPQTSIHQSLYHLSTIYWDRQVWHLT